MVLGFRDLFEDIGKADAKNLVFAEWQNYGERVFCKLTIMDDHPCSQVLREKISMLAEYLSGKYPRLSVMEITQGNKNQMRLTFHYDLTADEQERYRP